MSGTIALSYEQLHTINRSALETDFVGRILINAARDKAVRVTFRAGTSGAFSFGVLHGGKRVPVDQ